VQLVSKTPGTKIPPFLFKNSSYSINTRPTRFHGTGVGKSGMKNYGTTTGEATKKDDELWDDKKKKMVNPRTYEL